MVVERFLCLYSPRLWNKLPSLIRACTVLSDFKAKLKTNLFKLAYIIIYNVD